MARGIIAVMRMRLMALVAFVSMGVAVVVAALVAISTLRPSLPAPAETLGEPSAVLVGAGDIAECPTDGDEATAELLDAVVADHPDAVVFTSGDNAYPMGRHEDYADCYDPSWGRHKERTRPAVGNHDFGERMGAAYARYFGDAGGPFDRYYYSYDIGAWHVIVLNSECHRVGCDLDDPDGDQAEWLAADLADSDAECTLAIWHNARWSSGRYGNDPEYDTFWRLLHEAGAEIVVNGHDHLYERFAPLNPAGEVDEAAGIRQFIVGTGGGNLRGFREQDILPTSEARGSDHGVLKLTLEEDGYEWEFLPVEGARFTDSGSGTCH